MPKVADIHVSNALLVLIILNVISGVILYFLVEQIEAKRTGKNP